MTAVASPQAEEFRVQYGAGPPEVVRAASPRNAARQVRDRVCDASSPRHVSGVPITVRLADPKATGYWIFLATVNGVRFTKGSGAAADGPDDGDA